MANTINTDTLLVQMRAMASQAQSKSIAMEQTTSNSAFTDVLKNALNAVNTQQQQADQLADAFQKGDPSIQMAEVMVSLQKAGISFQAMVEVRNKLVSAYHDIMNIQV